MSNSESNHGEYPILDEACRRPLLRPLIGFNKVNMIALARKIGTYELSVKDQDDACRMMALSNHGGEAVASLLEVFHHEL